MHLDDTGSTGNEIQRLPLRTFITPIHESRIGGKTAKDTILATLDSILMLDIMTTDTSVLTRGTGRDIDRRNFSIKLN